MKKIISIIIVMSLVFLGYQLFFLVGESENEIKESRISREGHRGSTLFVGPGQTYTKIQDAIDNASSGDTICVYAGNYSENIIINKLIYLIGNFSMSTTIKGDGLKGDVVRITANGVSVSGFNIINSGTEDTYPEVDAGIKLDNVEYGTIANNTCTNNLYGIFLFKSDHVIIENNTCFNNTLDGIHIYMSNKNRIKNNNCFNNNNTGIQVQSNLKVKIFPKSGETGYAYYYGSKYNSYNIYYRWEYTYDYQRGWAKINLSKIPNNATIVKVVFNGYVALNNSVDSVCIRLLTKDPTNSSGSTVFNQAGSGTRLCSITGSVGWKKVDMGSSGVTAVQNALNKDWIGLGFDFEAPNTVNKRYGYLYGYNIKPLFLEIGYKNNTTNTCKKNVLINNNCSNNNNTGIWLQSASYTIIKNNECNSNNLYGIHLGSSDNNSVYSNEFINNTIQAYDDCSDSSNKWNLSYPNGGNYWSDWTLPDNYSGPQQDQQGSDGIVDKPYNISGAANAKDHYPLTSSIKIKNHPPIANVGLDQNVRTNHTVNLEGSLSYDPDGDPLLYKWSFGDGTSTARLKTSKINHSYTKSGNYTVTLTVFDHLGYTGSDNCMINVNAPPQVRPSAITKINISNNEVFSISLHDIFVDPDDDPLVFYIIDDGGNKTQYFATSNISVRITGNSNLRIQPKLNQSGKDTITLEGSDQVKPFINATHNLTINISLKKNHPPIAKIVIEPRSYTNQGNLETNRTIYFNGSLSSDQNGDPLQFKWLFGEGTKTKWSNSSVISHSYKNPANYTVVLSVSDGEYINNDTLKINIKEKGKNNAPVANAGFNRTIKLNDSVFLNGNKSFDPDGDRLSYKWDFGDGTESNWSNNSSISHVYKLPGNYTVKLTVSDGSLNDSDTCNIWVLNVMPGVPIIGPNFPTEIELDEDFGEFYQKFTEYEFHSNPEIVGDNLKWYATGNTGTIFHMTGDNHTGINADTFTLTSIPNQFGIEKLTFHLRDVFGVEVQIEQTVKIIPVNDPPEITELPNQNVKENEELIFDLREYISDIDNHLSEIRISTNDPYNITAEFTKLIINFTNKGNYSITIMVSDGNLTDETDISITVTGDPDKEEDIDIKGSIDIFQMLLIVIIIILILIVVIGKLIVLKKRPKTEYKPTSEDDIYGKTLNEIIFNNKDSELNNQEIKELLDKRYQKGEISEETYQDMKNYIENQKKS